MTTFPISIMTSKNETMPNLTTAFHLQLTITTPSQSLHPKHTTNAKNHPNHESIFYLSQPETTSNRFNRRRLIFLKRPHSATQQANQNKRRLFPLSLSLSLYSFTHTN